MQLAPDKAIELKAMLTADLCLTDGGSRSPNPDARAGSDLASQR
ncbi:hypothetical protein J2794_005742 [Paraburkholderia terricola]|nr:hypothetical protein [Paraburkholderia terricola]MDR6449604.1 hypothetical protein [Paraburkholderia terricola]